MGLSFETTEDLRRTAIDRVARQTETGDQVGVPLEDPSRFGVAMPIIDPAHSQNSYLVYKLLLAPENLAPCTSGCGEFASLPRAADCSTPPVDERRRMSEWFIQGTPMPPPRESALGAAELPPLHHLDCSVMRALTRWIDAGARCD